MLLTSSPPPHRVLAEVRIAVEDWRALRRAPRRDRIWCQPVFRLAEHEEFLRWLEANPFSPSSATAAIATSRTSPRPAFATKSCRARRLASCGATSELFDEGVGGGEAMAHFAAGHRS